MIVERTKNALRDPIKLKMKILVLVGEQVKKRPALQWLWPATWWLLIPARSDLKHAGRVKPVVHPYAGLGHQLTAWYSAAMFAQELGIKCLYSPLSADVDDIFGLRWVSDRPVRKEETGDTCPRTVRLPPAGDENSGISRQRLNKVARRHLARSRQVILQTPLDLPRFDLTIAQDSVRAAYFSDRLPPLNTPRQGGTLDVRIHIRRGDVGAVSHPDRWIDEDFYVNVISRLRAASSETGRSLQISIHSLGSIDQFEKIQQTGVRVLLNGDRDEDFSALVGADILVMAPSSFSYLAAIASHALVLARVPWWHHVPGDRRWIHLDNVGEVADPARLLDFIRNGHAALATGAPDNSSQKPSGDKV
ncbi:hypothetical protein O4220_05935 [Rhodococcus ruber]|uniref:Glycosyltransferase n=1 Tax=Rhodococcus ruber TaxID=1830 RepID=A0ABT4MAR6_9NOCA|nr:hypothetical protein [Rhodococcus ruber]MCZ4518052.1 hypothetical protein [Rhodococcus ruber]